MVQNSRSRITDNHYRICGTENMLQTVIKCTETDCNGKFNHKKEGMEWQLAYWFISYS